MRSRQNRRRRGATTPAMPSAPRSSPERSTFGRERGSLPTIGASSDESTLSRSDFGNSLLNVSSSASATSKSRARPRDTQIALQRRPKSQQRIRKVQIGIGAGSRRVGGRRRARRAIPPVRLPIVRPARGGTKPTIAGEDSPMRPRRWSCCASIAVGSKSGARSGLKSHGLEAVRVLRFRRRFDRAVAAQRLRRTIDSGSSVPVSASTSTRACSSVVRRADARSRYHPGRSRQRLRFFVCSADRESPPRRADFK